MRTLVIALLLASPALAQSPADTFRAAEQQYAAHRPEGMTWTDSSPAAAQALDTMWTAVIADANDFLLANPAATPRDLKSHLEHLAPRRDPRQYSTLSATVIRLDERLYAIAFTAEPASIVFILRPHPGAPIAWRISDASAQGKDTANLLRAWQSSQADEKCGDRDPSGLFTTCGPLTGSIGLLPASDTGAPRFYVAATYSKDAGASEANQLSIWEWEGSAPALLWIDRYLTHGGATRPVRTRGPLLTFGEQDEFKTFSACMACDSRQLLHTVQIMPTGTKDLGTKPLYPELDRVDDLFLAIAKHRPTDRLASPEVVTALQPDIRKAAKADPKNFSVGMLQDWSVTHDQAPLETVCLNTDALGQLTFTYDPTTKPAGFFKSVNRTHDEKQHCPTKNAIHLPYSEPG